MGKITFQPSTSGAAAGSGLPLQDKLSMSLDQLANRAREQQQVRVRVCTGCLRCRLIGGLIMAPEDGTINVEVSSV